MKKSRWRKGLFGSAWVRKSRRNARAMRGKSLFQGNLIK